MKNIVYTMIFLVSFSSCCSISKKKEKFIITKNNREIIITPDSRKWYVVSFGELGMLELKDSITYMGTYNNFHLIFNYIKSTLNNECLQYALVKSNWKPRFEFEYTNRTNIKKTSRLYQSVFDNE